LNKRVVQVNAHVTWFCGQTEGLLSVANVSYTYPTIC